MKTLDNLCWMLAAFAALPKPIVVAEPCGALWPLVYVNPAFERLTGCSASNLMGTNFLELTDSGGAASLLSVPDGQPAAQLELQVRRRDADPCRCELAIAPVGESGSPATQIIGILTDITAQTQAHDSLIAQRDQLLDFVAHDPLGILALDCVMSGVLILDAHDPAKPIIYVNAALERISGYPGEELIGQPLDRLFAGAGAQAGVAPLHRSFLEQREIKTELQSQRKDGASFWCELTLSPVFDHEGNPTHYLGILNDISERKQSERQLTALSEELRNSRDSLIAILNQFPTGTLILDSADTIAFCSATCGAIFGMAPESILGQGWRQALPFDAAAAHRFKTSLATPAAARDTLLIPWRNQAGAAHWVECSILDDPLELSRRLVFLNDVTELHRLRQRLETNRRGGLIGESEVMRDLQVLIGEVARGTWTVLVEGETGVGKELVARAIHNAGPRRQGPFIAVNSAGLSESLLASQLFGHRKGAFTGAANDHAGFFEAASGGTIFLDEIGDLPLPMQAALLRVLQEHEVTRLGENRARPVDARIIAATHRDLAEEVRAGRFREDLLFRLRVARVHIPPLRARKTDIPLLVLDFLRSANEMAGKTIQSLDAAAMQCLLEYDWPGNVRELRACIDFSSIHCRGSQVLASDLPPEIRQAAATAAPALFEMPADMDDTARIRSALQQTRGNRSRAADALGMSRSTFYRRLRELGLNAGA